MTLAQLVARFRRPAQPDTGRPLTAGDLGQGDLHPLQLLARELGRSAGHDWTLHTRMLDQSDTAGALTLTLLTLHGRGQDGQETWLRGCMDEERAGSGHVLGRLRAEPGWSGLEDGCTPENVLQESDETQLVIVWHDRGGRTELNRPTGPAALLRRLGLAEPAAGTAQNA